MLRRKVLEDKRVEGVATNITLIRTAGKLRIYIDDGVKQHLPKSRNQLADASAITRLITVLASPKGLIYLDIWIGAGSKRISVKSSPCAWRP